MMDLQEKANQQAEQEYQASRLKSVTLKSSIQDCGDTLQGFMYDIAGNTKGVSLGQLCASGNRLRGLGLLLMAVALSALVINFFLTTETIM